MSVPFKVVQPPDILDSSKATQFIFEIERLIETGVKNVVLDLKGVTFMSSSGLMALVSALRAVQAAGGTLAIHSISEPAKILLEITGLDQVFEMFIPQE